MEKEIFEGKYIIYPNGQIWSVRRNKFLKASVHHTGYTRICVDKKDRFIHRLVAEAFIPNPNNLPMINHINEIKSDNRVENLEWCNNRHNITHSIGGKNPGVHFFKGKYRVRICINGKNTHIGSFNTIEESNQFRLNFISEHNL